MRVYGIMAHDLNYGIGKDNKLPWHFRDDLKRFYQLTTIEDAAIVMGRSTYESLPNKPLHKRFNIILSRTMEQPVEENAVVLRSVDKLVEWFEYHKHIFIIGGADIFEQTLKYIDTLFITRVNDVYKCDTFMCRYEPEFNLVKTQDILDGQLTFEKWKRKQ